jgi:hypothetical protein
VANTPNAKPAKGKVVLSWVALLISSVLLLGGGLACWAVLWWAYRTFLRH